MDDYFQYRNSYINLYSGIKHYDLHFHSEKKEEEKNWFDKNSNCIRQQLILFCSTPFFEKYKSINPDLCTHIYNISSFVNYGIGDINDLRNPLNKPFANILKVGANNVKYTLSNFLHHINDDCKFISLDSNRTQIFKYNDDVLCFLLDTMFQKEDPVNSLQKAHNQLFSAYTKNLSIIAKILCRLRNENILYTKTSNISLDIATQYSEELVQFTQKYQNVFTMHPSSSHSIYTDFTEKSLYLTQFLTNNILNHNFKKIIKNSFNYNNTKESIFKNDPLFFYSMMFFILSPTNFSPMNMFSLTNMFKDEFDFQEQKHPPATLEAMDLLSDYYVSINAKDTDNLNDNSKSLRSLEREIQDYFDIDPVKKEKKVENFLHNWTKSFQFGIDNAHSMVREAKIRTQLTIKPENAMNKSKKKI